MGPLETLLWVYPLLLLLNGFVAVALWAIYRKSVFGLLTGFWISTLVNFAVQGAFLHTQLLGVLAFSSYILAAWFLVKILCSVSHRKCAFRVYWEVYALAVVASICLHYLGAGFTVVALPIAIAVALPQISFAVHALRDSQLYTLTRLFAIVLLINGLHFIDYPFLRPIPESAVFGYSLVIATSMLFGVLLPCIINNFLANELTRQLRDEVENHQNTARELEQALVVAEQSSRAKTVFLANVSHHLRTPINGIMGLNDLLLASPLTPEQQHAVQQVHASSNELLNMVDNVLTVSLLESGKVALYPKAFCLQQLLNELMEYYQGVGPLQWVIEPDPTHQQWVFADLLKIRQICINLINNAIKHSGGTQIRLAVSVNAEHSDLTINVQDDGVGIAPERLANLGLAFNQDEQSIHTGMGLGLSIASSLAELMGGEFSLAPGEVGGLAVHCRLPVTSAKGEYVAPRGAEHLAQASPSQGSVQASQSAAANQNNATGNEFDKYSPSLVLVVEDNPVNRMVISGMLKKLNVDFCMAEDGAEAMALYQEHQHHLVCILMDVQLPDANGLDLVEQIRQKGDKVPVLVISAFTFGDDEARAIEKGADAYLRKPYRFDEFKHALDDLGISLPLR